MNAREAISRLAAPTALDVDLNHDSKFFSVAGEEGFHIFSSESCELYSEYDTGGSLQSATILQSSQILGLVSGGSNPQYDSKRVQMFDTVKRESVATVTTTRNILKVRFSASHLALVFEKGINLYSHQPKTEKLASYDTYANPAGVCYITDAYLAFPGRTPGHVQLVDLTNLRVTIIPSHASPLVAITISPDSEVLASASQNGTLIRLHSPKTSARLGELRRGVTPASIWGIAISPSSKLLALTSDTLTLHIFELPHPHHNSERSSSTSLDKLSQRSENTFGPGSSAEQSNVQKWGGLAKLPLAPRFFSDMYSFASVTFDPGQEDTIKDTEKPQGAGARAETSKRYRKGVLGWLDNSTVVIVNAGQDARYERFALATDRSNKPICVRTGWSRFLRPN